MGNSTSTDQSREWNAPVPGDEEEQLRYQARQLIEQRNQCFEASRRAYQTGDGAGAKALSLQGKELDRQAKALNERAASIAFAKRNAGRPPSEVDLHGLKVQEAIAKVEQIIAQAKANNMKAVTLIVGKGLHSAPGGPKLKPAIIELIHKHNLRCTVGVPNEGCLYVEFVPAVERGWFEEVMGTLVNKLAKSVSRQVKRKFRQGKCAIM